MNNNYNPYQSTGQQGLPKPSFSGTLGSNDDENRNKHTLTNEIDEQYDPKRQRLPQTINQGYYNYGTTQQTPPNPYYNQPYMYGNMNQNYSQNYSQNYHQGYQMPINVPPQQNYIGYDQQPSMYENTRKMIPKTSQLTSYEDVYSNKKIPSKGNNGNTTNPSNNNKNNNNESKKKKLVASPIKKTPKKSEVEIKPFEDDCPPEMHSSKPNGKEQPVLLVEKIQESGKKDDDKNTEEIDDDEENGETDVVTVPGTSISLVSDEDIAKWREERKKMWLLKISNHKEQHREAMGIKAEEVSSMGNVLKESKKERQFIQSIQNQVNRFNPKVNLNLKIVQREMMDDNTKLLSFIKELGDAELLEYELSEKEKSALFGNQDENSKFNNRRNDKFRGNRSNYNNNNSRTGNNRNYKNYRNKNQK